MGSPDLSHSASAPRPTESPTKASVQDQLDGPARHRPLDRPKSKYNRVYVLLLQWAADDLGVFEELDRLRSVFESSFHFTTEKWLIPSIDPEEELARKLMTFKRGKLSTDLAILYYAGHAGGTKYECTWAANESEDTPTLNWHNVQSLLLGHQVSVLIILDCCFAALAATNSSIGNNWFLGASSKESMTTGVDRDSFTSALTRELERCAHRYWKDDTTFTLHTLYHNLVFHDRDLHFTPSYVRLTDHDCDSTDLTPLLHSFQGPQVSATSTDPLDGFASQAHQQLPMRPPPSSTTMPNVGLGKNSSNDVTLNGPYQPGKHFDLLPNDSLTLRISDLPIFTQYSDIAEWFSKELRSPPETTIAKMGPLVPSLSGSRLSISVTFMTTSLADRALNLPYKYFQIPKYYAGTTIKIDKHFSELTCLYTSKQPTLDIVLVHGIGGHPIKSFAYYFIDPSSRFYQEASWAVDELPKWLEAIGIFPRIMTYGWNANAMIDPARTNPSSCNEFHEALKNARFGFAKRPVAFVGHGVGGVLVKEVINQIINQGFGENNFENPVKQCLFLGVAHRGLGHPQDFAPILANMKSIPEYGVPADATLVETLRPRDTPIHNASTEFDSIRKEFPIEVLSFGEKANPAQMIVVPEDCAMHDRETKKDFVAYETDYRNLARMPRTEGNLEPFLQILCDRLKIALNLVDNNNSNSISEAAKEQMLVRLKKYDTLFLVDDSDSMAGRRWQTTAKVLGNIASIAVKYDEDGVDIRFFNSLVEEAERTHLTSSEAVMKLFNNIEPEGPTLTADILDGELNEYMYEYDKNRKIKGLNLIVLTDGEPEDDQKVEDVIVKYANQLREARAPSFLVGIQFVQIGSDEKATKFLEHLDDELKKDRGLDRDVSVPNDASIR